MTRDPGRRGAEQVVGQARVVCAHDDKIHAPRFNHLVGDMIEGQVTGKPLPGSRIRRL